MVREGGEGVVEWRAEKLRGEELGWRRCECKGGVITGGEPWLGCFPHPRNPSVAVPFSDLFTVSRWGKKQKKRRQKWDGAPFKKESVL